MRKVVSEKLARDMVSVAIAASFILGPGLLGVSGIALEAGGPVGSFLGWMASALLISPMVYIFYRMGRRDTSLLGLGKYVDEGVGPWGGLAVNLLFFFAALLIAPLILQVALE